MLYALRQEYRTPKSQAFLLFRFQEPFREFLYFKGDTPIFLVKSLVKYAGDSYPHRLAMMRTGKDVVSSRLRACRIRVV